MPHKYSFRREMVLHEEGCCLSRRKPGDGELRINGKWELVFPKGGGRLVDYLARDLAFFFAKCAGVYPRVRYSSGIGRELARPQRKIILSDRPLPGLEPRDGKSAAIGVSRSSVLVSAANDRALAKAVFRLEEEMKLAEAPILPLGRMDCAPLFSPRMTHSGYELDTFPDEYLEAVAHAGMDAILVYAGHPDSNLHGFDDPDPLWPGFTMGLCDFETLAYRAAGYGLDLYVYSQMKCDVHPDDPGAREYYDASFGQLMRSAPSIKGLVLVGESFDFPSKDPHTCGVSYQYRKEGETRPSPGWYPCKDYPRLLEVVGDVARSANPDVELVFWSYNWGWAPKEERVRLVRELPKGTTLLVTFEMWESFTDDCGRTAQIDDYSICFAGPSSIFTDEAQAARECGVKLYAMANTGGRTWDCGVVPYMPTPGQWIERYGKLREAASRYGLCGIMENHHYGWMPSFLGHLASNAFSVDAEDDAARLGRVAAHYFGDGAKYALEGWRLFDDGIRKIVASNFDQYGPLRSGPSYPLLYDQRPEEIHYPQTRHTMHKPGGIWAYPYSDPVFGNVDFSLLRLERMEYLLDAFARGNGLLSKAASMARGAKRKRAERILNTSRFLECVFATAINVMRWNMALRIHRAKGDVSREEERKVCSALGFGNRPTGMECYLFMREIALRERKNVKKALSLFRKDSLLGYEPSMEYAFDEETAAYKLGLMAQSLRRMERATRGKQG